MDKVTENISKLEKISPLSSDSLTFDEKSLKKYIEDIERSSERLDSPELFYRLGNAWRCYSLWYIRGDRRKEYLSKSLKYLNSAIDKATNKESELNYKRQLGYILSEDAIIRDISRALELLSEVYYSTDKYVPSLCSYAETLYKNRDYQLCAEVAIELDRRARNQYGDDHLVPPAPLRIAAKGFRALVKLNKKRGDLEKAYMYSKNLIGTENYTDNDLVVHEKLKGCSTTTQN